MGKAPSSIPLRRYSGALACDAVQVPRKGPFSSEHLQWYCEEAWIPEERLGNFIEGEEHRPFCNTFFKTVKTEEKLCPTTNERVRTKKRFHCCYRPLDARQDIQQNLPDSRKFVNGKAPLRHTIMTGFSVQRGCTASFYVTRYTDRAHAVRITWVNRNHVDKHQNPCHGFADKTAEFHNAQVAPRLSKRTWQFVDRLVRAGVSTTEIVMAHFQNLRNHWRVFFPNEDEGNHRWSRDMMLNAKDVQTIKQSVLKKKIDFNTPDHLAVHTWTKENKEKVFLYEQKTSDDFPFLLGWALEWQIHKAATLGQGHTIAMDATFGTNIWDLSLFTVLAYDSFQNGIPIAWGLMEKAKTEHLVKFLKSLKAKVEQERADMMLEKEWTPSCFMIDVASEEILSLSVVFPGIPIHLCLWHVRRAWTKNLIRKVKNPFSRADMNKELGTLMYAAADDHRAATDAFISRWSSEESTFTDYFRTFWLPKMERWMVKFRTFQHDNQNTNGAVERWHHTLKMHLRSQKATKAGRSVSWLLHMLIEEMELFYWCMLSLKFQGAIRNRVKERYVFASIHKAREIEDSQVSILSAGNDGATQAEVRTHKEDNTEVVHLVQNYENDNCSCTCSHAKQGNTCKHQIKVLILSGYDEMKLFNLLGTKWGTCYGGLEYEQELMEADEEDNATVSLPEEADISFPLRGFAELEAEENDEDMPNDYHEYSQEYYLGLVRQGFSKLEKMSSQMRNQVVVRLKGWLEWIKNEEVMTDPPSLDDFPLTQFSRPDGAENRLKRKKDHVELFWDKQKKGTHGKKSSGKPMVDSQNVSGCESLTGWDSVKMQTSQKGNGTADMDSGSTAHANVDSDLQTDDVGGFTTNSTSQMADGRHVPFVLKQKRKETDHQMLMRMARESLNLNNNPMDFEAIEDGDAQVAMTQKKGRKVVSSTSGKSIISHRACTTDAAPKRRGRPPGSKNKPKTERSLQVVNNSVNHGMRQPLLDLSLNLDDFGMSSRIMGELTPHLAMKVVIKKVE